MVMVDKLKIAHSIFDNRTARKYLHNRNIHTIGAIDRNAI